MSTIEDPRSRFHPNYLPRFDAIVASGVNPQAAAAVLSNELENARIMRNAKAAAPVKPAAPKAAKPAAAAPVAKPKASEKPLTAAEWKAVEATYRAIEQHHREKIEAVDPRTAELDAIFGTGPATVPGVTYDAHTGVQQFNVPIPVAPSKQQAAPAKQAASYSAPMPAPVPGMPKGLASRIEAAFGDGKPPADSVRMIGNRQVFGGRL